MKLFKSKTLYQTIVLVIIGVFINRMIADTASIAGVPLYLDSIGTMFVSVVGGLCPGMLVGFITNMIGGLSDSSTFYYGTINVLIAAIAGYAANKGYFEKITKVLCLIPFYLILSIPCSVLGYVLFDMNIADNVAAPIATSIHNAGFPILLSQILADFCIELPDKLISLVVAFLLVKLVPESVIKKFDMVAGRDYLYYDRMSNNDKRKSLRTRVTIILFMSGLAICVLAFLVSYKTTFETMTVGKTLTEAELGSIRRDVILFCIKLFSTMFGLLLCIVSFTMILANRTLVSPLYKMTKEMSRFAYDDSDGRDESVANLKALNITTENEIEELYLAMCKTVSEIDEYIDTTNEQSETIQKLQVSIITTLADVVESRDITTGHHVKRTAEYSALLAKKLKDTGKYTDIIDDDYIRRIYIAAPLHDIGKIKISDTILNKPGRLNDEEYEVIKTHTTMGRDMLLNASINIVNTEYFQMAIDIATYHHEWWDGSEKGYPERISGEAIPLSARIMAVADVLDALLSKRPYKDGYPIEKAMSIINEEKGTHFDPVIIDALNDSVEEIEKIKNMYPD